MTFRRKIAAIVLAVVTLLSCMLSTVHADTVKDTESTNTVVLLECICGKFYSSEVDRDYCIDCHKDEDGLFSCRNCRKTFTDADSYKLHEYDHIKKCKKTDPGGIPVAHSNSISAFKCICGKIYAGIIDYNYCLDSHRTISGHFACQNCNRQFVNSQIYLLHESAHIRNDKNTIVPDVAVSEISDSGSKESPSVFECFCGKMYVSVSDYNYCLDNHRDPRGYYICQNCVRQFINPQIYMLHESVHIKNDNKMGVPEDYNPGPKQLPSVLECVCGEQYVSIIDYNYCLDSHRNANGYFVCEFCDELFENPQNYKSHIDFCEKENEKTLFEKFIDTLKLFFENIVDFFRNLFA